MPILTTGLNTVAQADEILAALRAELIPMGLTNLTRGRLQQKPGLDFGVIVGPAVKVVPWGLGGVHQCIWTWTFVIARKFSDDDRREDLLDTWVDAALGTILDLLPTASSFEYDAEDLPERIEDHRIAGLLERLGEDTDAAVIMWSTRRQVVTPC